MRKPYRPPYWPILALALILAALVSRLGAEDQKSEAQKTGTTKMLTVAECASLSPADQVACKEAAATKPADIPLDMQVAAALLALDSNSKGQAAQQAAESAKAAQAALQAKLTEMTKFCADHFGEGATWKNDLSHFWCEAKPPAKPEPAK
jgi:hypothetical protein